MVKYVHTDHLDQGGKHASQGGGKSRPTPKINAQGEVSKANQPTSNSGAVQPASPSARGGRLSGTPGLVAQGPSARDGKDHLTPHPALTDANPGHGAGGSTAGKVDRTMQHGAGKSGDHLGPQPGLVPKEQKPAKYLTK